MTDREREMDLVAYLMGELSAPERTDVERALEASPELRAELTGLSEVLELSRGLEAPEPAPATLAAILAAVDEEQRVGEQLTALALGQLAGDEKAAAEALAAGDDRLALELRAIEDLISGARSEPGVVPSPQVLAHLREQIATEEREDGDSLPFGRVPAPVRRRGRPARLVAWLVPLAAAAALLTAFLVNDHLPTVGTQVTVGVVLHRPAEGRAASENWIRAGNGGVDFRVGDELQAADGAVSLRVRCFPASGDEALAVTEPPAGAFDLRLAPGARLERQDASHFELHTGSIGVRAGTFQQVLDFSHAGNSIQVRGTHFDATAVGDRLAVVVHEGSVSVTGSGSGAGEPVVIEAGEQGLASTTGVLKRTIDGRDAATGFLTPRVSLELAGETVRSDQPIGFRAVLEAGEGGPVEIVPFDDARPLYVVRLKGPRDTTQEVKLLSTMLTETVPPLDPRKRGAARSTFSLSEATPYRLAFSIPALDLEPGRWQAVLRYTAYAPSARPGSHEPAGEWLGVVESAAIDFEVTR